MNPSQEKNFGYDLEAKLYNSLLSLGLFDDIILERDLTKKWGFAAAGIDHFLVFNNYFIAIQTKWKMSRRRENNGVNNFLKSLEYIKTKTDKKLLFGLWASRLQPFEDNIELMNSQKIHVTYCIHDIDELVRKSVDIIVNGTKL